MYYIEAYSGEGANGESPPPNKKRVKKGKSVKIGQMVLIIHTIQRRIQGRWRIENPPPQYWKRKGKGAKCENRQNIT